VPGVETGADIDEMLRPKTLVVLPVLAEQQELRRIMPSAARLWIESMLIASPPIFRS
jgi:hypothetical protein